MTLHIADIPEEVTDLPRWLDGHLVGPDLGNLAAELSAIHDTSSAPPSLDAVLADQRRSVLSEGLQALPRERMRQLLIHPSLLLQLQELVLIEGGEYWERLLQATPPAEELTHALRQFKERLAREHTAPSPAPAGPAKLIYPWYRRPWLVSLLTAAAVLLIALPLQHLFQRPAATPTAPGWGWAKAGALPSNVSAEAYLNALADRAKEWFNKRPDQPEEVDRRIAEFRQGCSALIFAEHKPLSAGDRKWLVERCRVWATKLDKLREEVEAGRKAMQVRNEADKIINTLIEALQNRAHEVSAHT
jgi:hypothetical protein